MPISLKHSSNNYRTTKLLALIVQVTSWIDTLLFLIMEQIRHTYSARKLPNSPNRRPKLSKQKTQA